MGEVKCYDSRIGGTLYRKADAPLIHTESNHLFSAQSQYSVKSLSGAEEKSIDSPESVPQLTLVGEKKSNNLSCFLKGEVSVSLEDESFSSYNGVGVKYGGGYGSVEGYFAGKITDDTQGYFLEGKYTTPKIMDTNLSGEVRARSFTNWDKDGGKPTYSANFRGSIGYSTTYDDWSLYARAGVSANVSLHGEGVQTVSPTVICGIGYNVTPDSSIYAEAELSRGYDCQNHKWKSAVQPTLTFGGRVNF